MSWLPGITGGASWLPGGSSEGSEPRPTDLRRLKIPAGYSGTPQARKLGVKPGQRLCLDHRPHGWEFAEPPLEITYVEAPEPADLIISFFTAADQLPERLPELIQRIHPSGALWIAWPRRAGGHTSDITDNIVREHGLGLGVVDVKVAAIDDDWSGLRFVWRVENRAAR